MEIQLSVIIVNYNGERFLKNCLDSLQLHLNGINYEIIIIDNNSSDNSCAILREYYPAVRLIESISNLGFGKGNNEAVKYAEGTHLLLINNDTIVQDSLMPVLEVLKNDSTVGAIGIKMLDGQRKYLISVGKFPGLFTLIRLKNISWLSNEFLNGSFKRYRYDVDWVSGSFLMMPKKVYDEVQGFDEDYFMYVEDVDICKKIEKKQLKRIFLPQYSYIHFVGYNPSKDPLILQGWEMFVNKHYKGVGKAFLLGTLNINKAIKWFKRFLN